MKFHDEQKYPISKEESVKSTSCLDMCCTDRGVGTVQQRELQVSSTDS